MPNETQLTPGELKRQGIIEAACSLFRDLLGSHIDEACIDANDTFSREDGENAPLVKLGFAVEFPPLDEAPEVSVKLAWSVRKKDEATMRVDPQQQKLPFEDLRKEGTSITIKHGDKTVTLPAINPKA